MHESFSWSMLPLHWRFLGQKVWLRILDKLPFLPLLWSTRNLPLLRFEWRWFAYKHDVLLLPTIRCLPHEKGLRNCDSEPSALLPDVHPRHDSRILHCIDRESKSSELSNLNNYFAWSLKQICPFLKNIIVSSCLLLDPLDYLKGTKQNFHVLIDV